MEILVRYERCLGCHSCELACRVAHSRGKTLPAALAEDPPRRRIFVDQVGEGKMPFLCRHCVEAPCLDACIAGAMHRDERGLVLNEGGRRPCIGCWMCVMACPYGVINTDAGRQVAVKCDRACLDGGGTPACVAACPTRALQFTTVEEFSRRRRQECAPPA